MNIYPIYDAKQVLVCIKTFGHPNEIDFIDTCQHQFGLKPIRVIQKWQRERITEQKDDKGKIRRRKYWDSCGSDDTGAEAITIGLINGE
jgi:hypothetical protein